MLDLLDYIYQINRNWSEVLHFRELPESSFISGEEKFLLSSQKGINDLVITKRERGKSELVFLFRLV